MLLLRHQMLMTGALVMSLSMASSAQSPTLRTVMREKVENAERLLEPLVKGDFAELDKYVERLSRITYTEIGSWQRRPEGEYMRNATSFLNAMQGLKAAVRAKNLDRAFQIGVRMAKAVEER